MGSSRLQEGSNPSASIDGGPVPSTDTGQGSRPSIPLSREIVAVSLLVSLGLLLFGTADGLLVGSFNDDGVYVVLGKSIAEGAGYRSLHLPGAPVHAKYPPGLPLLLSLFWWLGGSLPNVVVLAQLANLAVVGGTAALSWWYGRTVLRLSAFPLALFGLGPFFLEPVLHYNSLILSEPYFLLCWLAVLVVYARLSRMDAGRAAWGPAGVLGVLLAAATLFRVQGIILTAAVLVLLAVQRRGLHVWLVCAASSMAPVLAWSVIHRTLLARGPVSNHPDELSYLDWVQAQGDAGPLVVAIRAVGQNVVDYARILAQYTSASAWVGSAVVFALASVVVLGIWHARRRDLALAGTLLAMVGIVLFWPFTQDRLVLSILPVAGLAAAAGVDVVLGRLGGRSRRIAFVALGLLALALGVEQIELRRVVRESAEAGRWPTRSSASFVSLLNSQYIATVSQWLTVNGRPTDIVLTEFPAGVYLHTGLSAVGSTMADQDVARTVFRTPGAFLARRILEDGVTIVTMGNLSLPIARDIAAVMARCPGVLTYAGGVVGRPLPVFYRVTPDERCLRERILGP